jgi:hypothetical protein
MRHYQLALSIFLALELGACGEPSQVLPSPDADGAQTDVAIDSGSDVSGSGGVTGAGGTIAADAASGLDGNATGSGGVMDGGATVPTDAPGSLDGNMTGSGGVMDGGATAATDALGGLDGNVTGSGGVMDGGGTVDAPAGTGGSVTGSGGVVGAGGGKGTVRVDLAVINFGTVDVGTVSSPVTVTVTVSGASVAVDPTIAGTGFAISARTCAAVQPVGTCTISVAFAPTSVGAHNGVLTVGTVAVALSGVGNAPASFSVTPDSISLGTLVVGESAQAAVTIIPTGTVPSLFCLASGADLTLANQTCPLDGPVSDPCSYTFTFTSATAGAKQDAIVCSGGGKATQTTVTANVVAPAALAISPSSQAFTAKVGQSATATFSVANIGGAPSGILTVAVAGAGFAVTSNDCPAVLAPLAFCEIQVAFLPALAGSVTGTLMVADTMPGSTPAVATLGGIGIAGAITIIPASSDFGTVLIGQNKAAAFTLANGDTFATDLIALATTDPQFAVGDDLCSGRPLATGDLCTFSVTFSPTSAGVIQATLKATQTSDGAVLASAALSGTGLGGHANLAVSPATLDFGTTAVGVPVGPLPFTVTNAGGSATGALAIIKTDGASSIGGASQFTIAGNTCTAALAPSASCQVAVTFAPTVVGSAAALITISDGVSVASGAAVGVAEAPASARSAVPRLEEF